MKQEKYKYTHTFTAQRNINDTFLDLYLED